MVIPSALPLRDYQRQAIEAITTAWAGGDRPTGSGPVNRVAIVMATGLGKTVIFAHLCLEHTGSRVLVVVHRDELAQQARDKIHAVAPHLRVGIVMGSTHQPEADVVIVSVQTVGPALTRWAAGKQTQADERRTKAHDIRGIGMIIVDEAHHAAAPTYRATLEHFGAYAGVPSVGVTATMSREDNRGLGEIWEEVCFTRDTLWGIRNGHLSDVRGIRVQVPELDLSGVHVRAGDLQQEETAQAMLDANTGEAIAKGVSEFAADRRGPLFAPNVATCHDFAEAMNDSGHRTEVIIGTTPISERRDIFSRLRTGKTRWIANAMVLTEGWDAPWADCAIVARPTKSPALYQQMVGRVLRPFPGKADALVMDVVGATTKHHLASLIDLSPDRPVRERQSVLEAWEDEVNWDDDELQLPEGWESQPNVVHKVIGTDVDLLAETTPSPWLQTRAGTWFIPSGELLFFLWPDLETGTVTIGVTSATRFERSTPLRTGLPFELAMTWAETLAADNAPLKTSKWRKAMPTKALIADARKLGIRDDVVRVLPAGPLFDDVSTERASKRLDR
jgi:superfamily II DNA or RNA helicase